MPDTNPLDHPAISRRLFHPRRSAARPSFVVDLRFFPDGDRTSIFVAKRAEYGAEVLRFLLRGSNERVRVRLVDRRQESVVGKRVSWPRRDSGRDDDRRSSVILRARFLVRRRPHAYDPWQFFVWGMQRAVFRIEAPEALGL